MADQRRATVTLLLVQGQQRMSRQQKLFILEQEHLKQQETKKMRKMWQVLNETAA